MNIEFYDHGVTAKIIVTCWFWEFRRYCRVVDAALFVAPEAKQESSGGILMRTIIIGKTVPMLGAFKVAKREAAL
ncbi:hypothetical protein VC899_07235 [Citrobacter braakii]|uniref:hypothetical protein n=1 Tax=Citrobacter braakii TaxID=57706 RepID=UPI002B2530EB|nr:hypothetical protein [Citrobacter braakii]MEB0964990.1 hypothetical protein [Citrobacter braakii]